MTSLPSGQEDNELSLRVVVLGLVLSVVMGAANVYLGLKAGMTVSASIPAAVVGMLILRGLFKSSSIREANQVQTAASAGESLAAGIIFTIPALVLIKVWADFDMVLTTLIAFAGGLLGILFMIPMRRVFVVGDKQELKFPEGVACAEVLRAGQATDDNSGAKAVALGAGIGALFKLGESFFHVLKDALQGATTVGNKIFYLGSSVSPALIAVGFIVRLNVAMLIFIGGAFAWLICIPLLSGPVEGDPVAAAFAIWDSKIRYIGVGAMVIGGMQSIVKVRHGLLEALSRLSGRFKSDEDESKDGEDLSGPTILLLSVVATCIVAGVYFVLTDSVVITITTTVIMIAMSFFFTAVASYIVGLVGNSNSPVSGMTITAVLFTGGLMLLFGFTGSEGMIATLGVAAIVCCAACTSGDVCNDLKTGQIVGATPYKQQIMQVAGVATASLVMAPVLQILHDGTEGGIGGPKLAAPQASLFASLAKGFFGEGHLPWDMVAIGVGVAAVIVILDALLEKRGADFRLHLMPIAVGIYLPFEIAPPILAGGLIAHFLASGAKGIAADKKLAKGILFGSGIIAGESLMGVGLAIPAALDIPPMVIHLPAMLQTTLTAVVAAAILYLFVRLGKTRS